MSLGLISGSQLELSSCRVFVSGALLKGSKGLRIRGFYRHRKKERKEEVVRK
jgi:hypothetical protein